MYTYTTHTYEHIHTHIAQTQTDTLEQSIYAYYYMSYIMARWKYHND